MTTVIVGGTAQEAKQLRTALGMEDARIISTYHRGAGRGLQIDLLIVGDGVAWGALDELIPSTYFKGGRVVRASIVR